MEQVKVNFIAVLILLAVLAVAILLLTPWFHSCNAKRVNDIRESYIREDAVTRVNSYEWFYDMYHQIEATRKKAKIAKGTPEEKGIRMVLSGMIQEYNAKSRMSRTRAQWKASDLPYQIEE